MIFARPIFIGMGCLQRLQKNNVTHLLPEVLQKPEVVVQSRFFKKIQTSELFTLYIKQPVPESLFIYKCIH